MLPGLRFLFAATLMSASLLVFGMGAIALLRASHQQFAAMPPMQPPEPVFAQAPATVPSLALLRADPAPAAPPLAEVIPQQQQEASLSTADRMTDPAPLATGVPTDPADGSPRDAADARRDVAPSSPTLDVVTTQPSIPDLPKEATQAAPLVDKSAAPAAGFTAAAEAPAQQSPEEPAKDDAAPATAAPSQQASAPADTQAPETTGSIASSPEGATVADPPVPQARPEIDAPKSSAEKTSSINPAQKRVAKRKVRHARLRHSEQKREKLPATTSAPTLNLGSLFGANNN